MTHVTLRPEFENLIDPYAPVGQVGTGFDEKILRDLRRGLDALPKVSRPLPPVSTPENEPPCLSSGISVRKSMTSASMPGASFPPSTSAPIW